VFIVKIVEKYEFLSNFSDNIGDCNRPYVKFNVLQHTDLFKLIFLAVNKHRLFQLGLYNRGNGGSAYETDLIFHIMFYCKLYILTLPSMLECAINANGHLFELAALELTLLSCNRHCACR